MIDLKQLQREVYQNKVEKGFNITDICRESWQRPSKLMTGVSPV